MRTVTASGFEIVYLQDEGEDLDGRGPGWRRFQVTIAVTSHRGDICLQTVPACGRELEAGRWLLDLGVQ